VVRVARMGEGRGVYRVLVGRPEGKRPLGRPRSRWENNINIDSATFCSDGEFVTKTDDNNYSSGTLTSGQGSYFTPTKIQVQVFWVVTLCSVTVGYKRVGEPCCLLLH
jgi:hypothetical protein